MNIHGRKRYMMTKSGKKIRGDIVTNRTNGLMKGFISDKNPITTVYSMFPLIADSNDQITHTGNIVRNQGTRKKDIPLTGNTSRNQGTRKIDIPLTGNTSRNQGTRKIDIPHTGNTDSSNPIGKIVIHQIENSETNNDTKKIVMEVDDKTLKWLQQRQPSVSFRLKNQTNTRNIITLDSIQKICSEKYNSDEHRVIVIVLSRYTIKAVENMVKTNYDFWHEYSETKMDGRGVDFFWLGYYVEEYQEKGVSPYNFFSDVNGGAIRFDTKSFVKEREKLSRLQKYRFGDTVGYLICNYYDGSVHYDNSVFVDIERLVQDSKDTDLRKVTECLIDACAREQEAKNVGTIIRTDLNMLLAEKSLGGLISTGLSLIGIGIDIIKF